MSEKLTRSKKSDSKTDVTETKKKLPSSGCKKHVFFLNNNLLESGQDIYLEKMRHPGTEAAVFFIFSKATNQIFEIFQFTETYRSWFIDQSVSSDGRCSLTVPIDPMFFALYYLYKNCLNQVIPFDQIADDDFPKATEILEDFITNEMLLKIADRIGSADLKAYKLNKDKTLAWLALKTELVKETLRKDKIQIGEDSISANYIKEESSEILDEDLIRSAAEIVGGYIPFELYGELKNYLNIREPEKSKRKSQLLTTDEMPSAKKMKADDSNFIVSPPPAVKEKKVSAKEKALKKAASGTKSISSFFKK